MCMRYLYNHVQCTEAHDYITVIPGFLGQENPLIFLFFPD